MICLAGLKMGKVVINTFTMAKIALVTFMIIGGLASWSASDYGFKVWEVVNGAASTALRLGSSKWRGL